MELIDKQVRLLFYLTGNRVNTEAYQVFLLVNMSDGGPEMPVLEVNSTDATNNSGASNSTLAHGSCGDQCVDRSIVFILGAVLGGTVIVGIILFVLYRKRAKRKEREAGDVSIDISRPKRKK